MLTIKTSVTKITMRLATRNFKYRSLRALRPCSRTRITSRMTLVRDLRRWNLRLVWLLSRRAVLPGKIMCIFYSHSPLRSSYCLDWSMRWT